MIEFKVGDTLYTERKGAMIFVRIIDATFFTFLDKVQCNLKIEHTVEESQRKTTHGMDIELDNLSLWLEQGIWRVHPGASK